MGKPSEDLKKLFEFLADLTHFIGLSFFELPRWNRRLGAFCVMIVFFIATILNTAINGANNISDLFQMTMMISLAIQGFSRMGFYFTDPQPYVEVQTLTLELYKRCETRPDQKKNVVDCLQASFKVVKFVALLYAICIFGPLVFSMANFILYGITVTPYPLDIPFVDRHTTIGFIINFTFQLYISAVFFVGYTQIDSHMFLFAWQVMAYVDAFKCKLNDFEQELSATMKTPQPDTKEIRKQLRQAIDSYTEIRMYNDWLKRLLTKPAFIIVTVSTYSVCSCGIALLIGKYYSAIGFIIQSLFLLLIYCMMGSFVKLQQERMLDFLWEFKWYKLPYPVQKDFLLFMMSAQKSFSICPTIVGVLDLELFIKILNSIYSYFTVMWNLIHG